MGKAPSGHMNDRQTGIEGYKAQVCRILKWTELQYAEFQQETGIKYLRLYIPDDQAGADMLIRSRIYWQWWINHWQYRDASFLLATVETLPVEDRRFLYKAVHEPEDLLSKFYPGKVVLDESYAEMIGRLFDAEIQHV